MRNCVKLIKKIKYKTAYALINHLRYIQKCIHITAGCFDYDLLKRLCTLCIFNVDVYVSSIYKNNHTKLEIIG